MTSLTPGTGRGEDVKALDGAILRIFGPHGAPVGAGFLITDRLALTCAHVVTAALGLPDDGTWPAAFPRVKIDLPLLPGSEPVDATVERFLPAQGPGNGDVAVLRLDAAVGGARPVRLLESQELDLWDHPARAVGFPAGRGDGEWHRGVLRARQASGWVQADMADANGYRVTFGFSGSPVWDDTLGGVVGMTVEAEPADPPVSYLIPADGLLAEWPDLRMQLFLDSSPFRGLEAFGEADARVFCGRGAQSAQLAAKVAGGRWTTLVGPSGCGKSSLVMAGVVPLLREQGYCPVVIRPSAGSSPLAALAGELLPLLEPHADGIQRVKGIGALAGILAASGGLADITGQVSAMQGGAQLLIVIDQLEELFARTAAEIGALADVLFGESVPESVRVLATLRADFLETALATPGLGNAFIRPVEILHPMDPGQLRESITGPVAGVEYQARLVDRILSDTGTDPGGLPLLQFTLDQLWRSQSGGKLTHEAYDKLGGVRGALKRHIETKWKQYVEGEGYDDAAARGLLTKLVRVPIGSVAAARRTALRTELSEGEWDVAQHLAASRLLVTGRSAEGTETVELAHEAVITAWDDLAAWVQADRTFLEWRESLRHDMARWERGHRNPDLLPSPATLATAKGREDDLDKDEQAYVRQGHARRRARARRRRSLVGVLGVLILAAGGAGIVSVHAQQDAARKAAVVRSGTLAADSQALSASDPGLAAQLAVAAYRSSPTQAATAALYNALQSPMLDNELTTTKGTVERTAAQADGPLAAAVDLSGAVRVWNLSDPARPILASTIQTTGPTGIAFTPRAPLLAAACSGKAGLCLWNLADPARPMLEARLPTPASGPFHISSMAISPDGTLLAAASERGYTLLWSIAQPTHPSLLADLPNLSKNDSLFAAVAFPPGGSFLAESHEDGTTSLWSLSDPAAPTRIATVNSGYQDIAIDSTGTILAGDSDSNLDLWSIRDPAAPKKIPFLDPLSDLSVDLQSLSISPDGRTLAFGGTSPYAGDSEFCLLDLADFAKDPDSANPTCQSTGFSTYTMAYTSSGALMTGGLDDAVRLWRASPALIANATIYSPDSTPVVSTGGHYMVTAITDLQKTSALGIWDLDTPGEPTLAGAIPLPSSAAAYAAFLDTNVVLTETQDGNIQIWNISDPQHPRQTASLGNVDPDVDSLDGMGPPNGIGSSNDLLAVLGGDGVMHLWHVSSNGTATQSGTFTDPASSNDPASILGGGNTAFMTTKTGIDWWNLSNPARPIETGASPLANADLGEGVTSSSGLFAAATPPDVAGGGSTLNLYNLANGHVLSTAVVSRTIGPVLDLSNDGHLLAASGISGNGLSLWNTTDARAPKLASSLVTAFDLAGVTFSDDDEMMADWTQQTVQLWDTQDPGAPDLVGSFSPAPQVGSTTPDEQVSAAGFAQGGSKLVVSTESDGPSLVYVLDTNPRQAADQLCSATTSPITPAQWAQDAPGVSYQNPCSK
jgi:hypothetical protein